MWRSLTGNGARRRGGRAGVVLAGAVLMLIGVGGCAQPAVPGTVDAPAQAPGDPVLRELAATYIRRGMQYPGNPAVRAQAVEAAEEVMGSDALPMIRKALKDEHAGVRFAACMALGRLKDPSAGRDLRGLLRDPNASVRVGVYFALERLGDLSHRAEWSDMLRRHADPTVRRNAALSLGVLGDPKAVPLLDRAAASDPDDGVRLQALEAMARLGDKIAIGRFLQYSIAGQSFRQPFALLTLRYIRDDRVAPALRTRLASSPYLEARLAAARSLGALGYDEGFDLALASLEWDQPQPDPTNDDPPATQIMRVRSMAAMALGDIGNPRALDALTRRMKTPDDPRVQLAAATAMLMILNGSGS